MKTNLNKHTNQCVSHLIIPLSIECFFKRDRTLNLNKTQSV